MPNMDDFIRDAAQARYQPAAEPAATDPAVVAMADQIATFSRNEHVFGSSNVMIVADDGSTSVVPDADAEGIVLTGDEIRAMNNGIAEDWLRTAALAGYAPTAEEAASAGGMDGWLRRSV